MEADLRAMALAVCWLEDETRGETEHTNRSRLPMDPTWVALREQFTRLVMVVPLDEDTRELVRGAR